MSLPKALFLTLAGITVAGVAGFMIARQPLAIAAVMKPEPEPMAIAAPVSPVFVYGMEITGKSHCYERVKNGESFSVILQNLGMPAEEVQSVLDACNGSFNPARITAGKTYCIVSDPETHKPEMIVYEENMVDYVVFSLHGDVKVDRCSREVKRVRKTASGIIQSSLWATFEEQGLPYELALKMSEIYAWSIDFFRLQKGDRFRIDYEEDLVEGASAGFGKIYGVQFEHGGKIRNAFYFEQDGHGDFFDEEGNGSRKAFLKAPLKFTRISSGFSMRRFHPITKKYTPHPGIDYAAPMGTPIMSVGDGVVLEAQFKGGNGNYVKIKHNATYSTQYLHMSKFGAGIRAGAHVSQGQVIGYVGSTGLSTGPHLCYRFWKNGVQVNPLAEEFPTSEPVKKENMDAFRQVAAEALRKLQAIPFWQEASGPDAM